MTTSLHQLSSRSQILVFGGLCGLVVVGGWQLLLGPERAALERGRAQLTALETEVTRVKAMALDLPMVERQVRALEIALREATAIDPGARNPVDVLRTLHELASESGLDIASFSPKAIVMGAQHSEWPVQLGFEGNYHDLARFLDRVAARTELMSVSDLDIKSRQRANGRGTVTVTCVATTFVFKSEASHSGVGTLGAAPPSGYDSGGRRDPFVSAIVPRPSVPTPAPGPALAGLRSIALADVIVTGIVRHGDAMAAILQGADRRSFVAHEEARLLDAVVRRIDSGGVVFVEVVATGPGKQPREIRKALLGASR